MSWRHIWRGDVHGSFNIPLPTLGVLKALLIKADPAGAISTIELQLNRHPVMDIPTDFLNVLWIPIDLGTAEGLNRNDMAIYAYADVCLISTKVCKVSVWEMLA